MAEKNELMSFIGGGDLYMDRLTASGESTGLIKAGNAIKLALRVASETVKLTARGRDNYGQTLASVTRITASTVNLDLNQIDRHTLAAIFMGEAADRTGAGGDVTDKEITARVGRWVELGHLNVSAVVVKDNDDIAPITYTAGIHYELSPRLGMIRVLAAEGGPAEGDTLVINYTWAAETGFRITGATRPEVKVALLLDGKNDHDGTPVIVKVFEGHLRPASEVDFLSEDFTTLQFEGEMITPPGKSWPFEMLSMPAAAA